MKLPHRRAIVTAPVTKAPAPPPDLELLVVVADLHSNSTVGLCPPAARRDQDAEYKPNPQFPLWDWWLDFWQQIAKLKTQYQPARVRVVVAGDALDKNQHSHYQLIEPESDEVIVDNGVLLFAPIADIVAPDSIHIMEGTKAHVGSGGALEGLLAKRVGAVPDGKKGAWVHMLLRAGGVLYSIAHHPGEASYKSYTRGNDANRLATRTVMEYGEEWIRRGQHASPPPLRILRAHNHIVGDSGWNHPQRAIILPAWQLCTEYGARTGHVDEIAHIGGYWAACRNGAVEAESLIRYYAERRAPWESNN